MKKTIAILALIGAASLLAACGSHASSTPSNALSIAIAGPTTVEVSSRIKLNVSLANDTERLGYTLTSSDTTKATVDASGYVTGVALGSITITATAAADASVTASYAIDVIESSIPSATITSDSATTILGANTLTFKANLNNPTSYTPTIHWSSRYGKGTFVGDGKENQDYRPLVAGNDIVDVAIHVGPYFLSDSYKVFIKSNYEDGTWVAIASLTDFKNKVRTGSNVSGNYYLSQDIDCAGEVFASDSSTLVGTLDGRGHSLKNYVVSGGTDGSNGGLFNSVKGTIRNMGFACEIAKAGSGWGTAAIALGCSGTMENILLDVNHSFDNGTAAVNGYVAFNAGVVGIAGGGSVYHDIVVNVQDTAGKATIYADTAYPAGGAGLKGGDPQSFSFSNFYTNTTVIGGQKWDWGDAVKDQSGENIGIDWSTSTSKDFALNPIAWTLSDGSMPTLAVLD